MYIIMQHSRPTCLSPIPCYEIISASPDFSSQNADQLTWMLPIPYYVTFSADLNFSSQTPHQCLLPIPYYWTIVADLNCQANLQIGQLACCPYLIKSASLFIMEIINWIMWLCGMLHSIGWWFTRFCCHAQWQTTWPQPWIIKPLIWHWRRHCQKPSVTSSCVSGA